MFLAFLTSIFYFNVNVHAVSTFTVIDSTFHIGGSIVSYGFINMAYDESSSTPLIGGISPTTAFSLS